MVKLISKDRSKINVDLAKERQKCTFNTLELTHLLDGGVEETEKRRLQESNILDDPEITGGPPYDYLSHKEKYEETMRKIDVLFRKLGRDKVAEFSHLVGSGLETAIFRETVPLDVHFGMFIPTINAQGTDEQKENWIPRAINCNILGTYAQTELGHGTFIRGIETTATYDPKTEEFVLNSPTLTSLKWWPAGLGNTSNYAILLAQLHSLGVCHGVHMFIVQLRDEETHQPLPGIELGDIGPRLGINGANNGFLSFRNVRIPRENMLMKYSKILKDGAYVHPVNNKLAYGSMVFVRVSIVKIGADLLKKCVTIAVRYSAVRRQSQQKPGEPECQIMDYLTQQNKLFPQIASYFALKYSALHIKNMYNQVTLELEAGNLNQLHELHTLASCLKAVAASDVTIGVERCRLACGGHGYMMCSGFPHTYGLATAMVTYEGENTVLLLQTARSLMKAWTKVVEGKPLAPIVNYFKTVKDLKEVPFERSIDWIVWALERITVRKIESTWNHLNSRIQRGVPPEDSWNLTSIELVAAAEVYARTFIVKTYSSETAIAVRTVSQPLKTVLLQLLQLYGVYVILNLRGDLLRFTATEGACVDDLEKWLVQLLGYIRPNAVGLVDSFDIHDKVLSSALGAYDGNVYERLFEEALKSPLNSEPVNRSFDLYLKPFIKSNL